MACVDAPAPAGVFDVVCSAGGEAEVGCGGWEAEAAAALAAISLTVGSVEVREAVPGLASDAGGGDGGGLSTVGASAGSESEASAGAYGDVGGVEGAIASVEGVGRRQGDGEEEEEEEAERTMVEWCAEAAGRRGVGQRKSAVQTSGRWLKSSRKRL